jgi:hypothetical protein
MRCAGMKIDQTVRADNLQREIGVAFTPIRQTWNQPTRRKRISRRYNQRGVGRCCAHQFYRPGERGEAVADTRQQASASISECHRPRPATK